MGESEKTNPGENLAHLRKSESIFERAAYYAAASSWNNDDISHDQAQADSKTLLEIAEKSKWMKGEVAGFLMDQKKAAEKISAGFAGVIGLSLLKYILECRGREVSREEMAEIQESIQQICLDGLESQAEMDLAVISEMIDMRLQSLVDRKLGSDMYGS